MVMVNSKIGFVSLGCPKALVDSERILTQLRADGYEVVATYEQADLVVVNTCGFIKEAVEESLAAIGEALEANGKVIVTGCLGTKKEQILAKFPQVLHVSGPQAYEEVVGAIHAHIPPNRNPFTSLLPAHGVKLTPRHYAYLKISEGCNHRCTFCIIPSMRGNLISRPISQVLNEAESLVKAGVKELLVISQDTSAYGVDLKYQDYQWRKKSYRTHITDLADGLGELGAWIRLHYVYPYPHVDHLIPLMVEGKILPYLDVPLQHASKRILKDMKRPANTQNNLERIRAWRTICPELTIRSTFIVGFPGETDDDFKVLLDFLEEAQLNRVGCFKYSAVEGAKANELPNAIPEQVKEERWHRFMEKQHQISMKLLEKQVGTYQWVLIDGQDDQGFIARSMGDAPEIDGKVYLEPNSSLKVGDLIKVKIIDSNDYDLYGEYTSNMLSSR
jgi:ribosomal protein S12 methylthiotransferase